jgi:hypothetical protein
MNILLGNFSTEVGEEIIFKLTVGSYGLQEIINGNGIRVLNFTTLKI